MSDNNDIFLDHTDSSIYDQTNSSACDHPNYSGSDIAAYLPPTSNPPTEVSSAMTSDSDLPPPLPHSSKPSKQAGLLNYFSAIPSNEAHATWAKRKRDNQEGDKEKRAKLMQQEEEWREEKRQKLRNRNRINQQRHRKKAMDQESEADMEVGTQGEHSVSEIFVWIIAHLSFKTAIQSNREMHILSRSEVATASRPKKAIVAVMKKQNREKAGKNYTPSKRDAASNTAINWKSPMFWPMIDMAARRQVGKPNLSKLVEQLRQQDPRFNHLTHRRISEWRDKNVKDRIVWSEETIASVKKEFLPGGHQTRYNVFVGPLSIT